MAPCLADSGFRLGCCCSARLFFLFVLIILLEFSTVLACHSSKLLLSCPYSIIFCEAVAIYGVIMAFIMISKFTGGSNDQSQVKREEQLFAGFSLLWSGLTVGLSNLAWYGVIALCSAVESHVFALCCGCLGTASLLCLLAQSFCFISGFLVC